MCFSRPRTPLHHSDIAAAVSKDSGATWIKFRSCFVQFRCGGVWRGIVRRFGLRGMCFM
jgi:hypothetical protein